MTVKAFEEDMTSNEYMGQGTLDLSTLKLNGTLEIKILGEGDDSVGTVYAKYAVKSLQPSPMLVVKNVKADFYK